MGLRQQVIFRADIEGRSSEIYPKSKADAGMRILGNQTAETLTWRLTARTLTAVQTTAVQTTPYHRRVEAQICASPSVPDHREAPERSTSRHLHICSPHHVQGMSSGEPWEEPGENPGKDQWRTRWGGENNGRTDLCLSIYYLGISKGPNLSSNSTRLPDWIWAPTNRIKLSGSRLCGLRDLNSGRSRLAARSDSLKHVMTLIVGDGWRLGSSDTGEGARSSLAFLTASDANSNANSPIS